MKMKVKEVQKKENSFVYRYLLSLGYIYNSWEDKCI